MASREARESCECHWRAAARRLTPSRMASQASGVIGVLGLLSSPRTLSASRAAMVALLVVVPHVPRVPRGSQTTFFCGSHAVAPVSGSVGGLVSRARTSLVFKETRVVRLVDLAHRTLVYLA